LTLARLRRGYTKSRLAAEAGVTMRSISAYESGETEPTPETLEAIAERLKFPVTFFYRPEVEKPPAVSASFRSLSSMTASQRHAALGAGALAVELSDWIEKHFRLPEPDVPSLRGQAPEAAADALRESWQLGVKPVRNMVHLLEQHGVRVFSLAEECRQVDAFSVWRSGKPFVFLNTMKSGERSRFDAAHELGHLVLHRHGGPRAGREAEQQADSFASAFLMPRRSVLASAPPFPSVDGLVKLKKEWSVAVSALAYRLHDIGLLTDWHYRTLMIQMSSLGYRTTEPDPIQRETSQVLSKVFKSMREKGWTRTRLAAELDVRTSDIDALVFGLAFVSLSGGRSEYRPDEQADE
jgi:Zn-dependent peptidase ImmA (M78 family)/DNA-binding XRE family transcriptional regulator